MADSVRISVRLSGDRLARLEIACRETGSDVSDLIRRALDHYLGTAEMPFQAPPRLAPPEYIIETISPYLAWSGDLRQHRKKLFEELLAVSFVVKHIWCRTPGVVEAYEGLLRLLPLFGVSDDTRQRPISGNSQNGLGASERTNDPRDREKTAR